MKTLEKYILFAIVLCCLLQLGKFVMPKLRLRNRQQKANKPA